MKPETIKTALDRAIRQEGCEVKKSDCVVEYFAEIPASQLDDAIPVIKRFLFKNEFPPQTGGG